MKENRDTLGEILALIFSVNILIGAQCEVMEKITAQHVDFNSYSR